ncbi:MAG: hypothetical protein ACREQ9_06325, partial [Candidatus Binatia bacterium]
MNARELVPTGVAALALLAVAAASAHPVAQGSLDVELTSDAVLLRAEVATEEAFVASALSPESAAGSPATLWEEHGRYLVAHLRVYGDERKLDAEIVAVQPPGSDEGRRARAPVAHDRIVYDVEYALGDPSAGVPRTLRLEQDLLNEIEFAPGNRWEATFVVGITEPGGRVAEGLLLTSREPLVYRVG